MINEKNGIKGTDIQKEEVVLLLSGLYPFDHRYAVRDPAAGPDVLRPAVFYLISTGMKSK